MRYSWEIMKISDVSWILGLTWSFIRIRAFSRDTTEYASNNVQSHGDPTAPPQKWVISHQQWGPPNNVPGRRQRAPRMQDFVMLMRRPMLPNKVSTLGMRWVIWAAFRNNKTESSMNHKTQSNSKPARYGGISPCSFHIFHWSFSSAKRAATMRPKSVGLWLLPCCVPRVCWHHLTESKNWNCRQGWSRTHRRREARFAEVGDGGNPRSMARKDPRLAATRHRGIHHSTSSKKRR